eukprot:jgi/Undpi1/2122/HiC_scaffold_12.g05508.m1
MPNWPSMSSLVQESEGPQQRQKSFKPLVGTEVVVGGNLDVENQSSAKGAVVILNDEDDQNDDDVDPGIDDVESRMTVLTFLKIVTFFSALYMATNPWFFFYDADKKEICPYSVLCATSPAQLTLLTLSRVSAGILFASLTISIFSKCYATRSYLHHSWLGAVLDFEPTHDIHTYFGYLTLVSGFEHGLLHCSRFIIARQSYLIYETDTGRSGMVACLLMLPIVLPMKFEFFRTKIPFQTRKNMHMTFLALLVALCFHSVVFRYVGSILIVWYLLDRLYFTTKQTFLITHPVFEAVGRGTMVSLDLPEGYTFKAGSYIYVNSPTISRSEWHPFSIIQVPGKAPRAAFYAEAVGDWTQELFHLGLNQPRLPLWITAAQPSLMEKSIYYDNLVLMCTGAGITPAVSIIERFAKRKNIHLMWMSRDGGMIALFEKQLRKVNSTVHLTGKPTSSTKEALQRLLEPSKKYGSKNKSDKKKTHTHTHGVRGRNRKSTGRRVRVCAAQGGVTAHGEEGASRFQSRRPVLLVNKPANPVTLEFGRPDIGKYLTETFGSQTAVFASIDETGRGALGPIADRSMAGSRVGGGGRPMRGRQGSARLDASQVVSKDMLMKADPVVVGTVNQRHPTDTAAGAASAGDGTDGKGKLPWLVLYCGANPKVEEAIGKTCDELHVQWQKEYFGAW